MQLPKPSGGGSHRAGGGGGARKRPDLGLLVPDASRQEAEANFPSLNVKGMQSRPESRAPSQVQPEVVKQRKDAPEAFWANVWGVRIRLIGRFSSLNFQHMQSGQASKASGQVQSEVVKQSEDAPEAFWANVWLGVYRSG